MQWYNVRTWLVNICLLGILLVKQGNEHNYYDI